MPATANDVLKVAKNWLGYSESNKNIYRDSKCL